MKKNLTNNLFLKILSVVFAFILWLVVVNINDPDKTSSILGIPITIINEEKITGQGLGQIYYIESPSSQTGSVVVKGARSIIDNLKPTDIKATVDFGNVSSVGAVTINYTMPDGVSLVAKRTEVMRIVTEAMKTDTFDVSIMPKGSTADGYLLGDSKVSPSRVRITAPESVLNSIKNATVEIDVDGVSTDIVSQATLHLYDGNGTEIAYEDNSNITISATSLIVGIEMLRTQIKPLEIEIAGEVQDGYRFLGMNCEVTGVAVKGLSSHVMSFTAISVPASSGQLDLSEVTEVTEVTIDLNPYLPEGVTLVNESDRYVQVTLDVQPLYEKELYFSMSEINMRNVPEDMDLSFNTGTTVVAVMEGLLEDIEALTVEELNPTVDLRGLSEGIHRLVVELNVPEGIKQLNTADIYIILTRHVEEIPEEVEEAVQENLDASQTAFEGQSEGGSVRNDSQEGSEEPGEEGQEETVHSSDEQETEPERIEDSSTASGTEPESQFHINE